MSETNQKVPDELIKEYFKKIKTDNKIMEEFLKKSSTTTGALTFSSASKVKSKDAMKVLNRIETAMQHYLEGDPSLAEKPNALFSHLNGIDFRQPVEIVTIPKDSQLFQMQAAGKGTGETRQGNYYTFYEPHAIEGEVAEGANLLGISDMTINQGPTMEVESGANHQHYAEQKQSTEFNVNNDVRVLQSVTAPIADTWSVTAWVDDKRNNISMETEGGGHQLHVNPKDNAFIVPKIKLDYEMLLDKSTKGKLTKAEQEKFEDTFNTYAMVLYNRSSYRKDLLIEAIDAFILAESSLESTKHSKNNIDSQQLKDCTKVFEHALIAVVRKHEKIPSGFEGDRQAHEIVKRIVEERKSEQSLSSKAQGTKPNR